MAASTRKPVPAEKVIKCFGSGTRLAKLLGINHQGVYVWKRVPCSQVLNIEALPECTYTRYQMRPDVFGNG